jgi:heme o synthase
MKRESKPAELLSRYTDLVKYRLSLAVTFSSAAGYLIAGRKADPGLIVVSAGVLLLASGSAALNQVQERRTDALMERTAGRPIPCGKLEVGKARISAALLLVSGTILLLFSGIYPAILGVACILLYNLLYTILKPRSILAVIPGALTGAIPPAIGFTAAGGSIADPRIICLSSFMFLWQLPHFWLVILKYRDDYYRAGFRNLAGFIDPGRLKLLVLGWVMVTSAILLGFLAFSDAFGRLPVITTALLNPLFIILFIKALFPGEKPLKFSAAFILLNTFGFLLIVILVLDSLLKNRG